MLIGLLPVAKRLFDILGSAVALLLLAPLLLLVAVAVRISSPGPVLFRQVRVGQHGVPFRIHKFRTMRVDAAARGPEVTVAQDGRITQVGRFLRHFRIDEMPQFLDVLRGAMSLVGPRPEVPRFVAHYPAAMAARVLAVRPGITDPASLAHIDEAALLAGAVDPERAYIERILPAKLALQADYAARATLGTDLAVLGHTLRVLLSRRP